MKEGVVLKRRYKKIKIDFDTKVEAAPGSNIYLPKITYDY